MEKNNELKSITKQPSGFYGAGFSSRHGGDLGYRAYQWRQKDRTRDAGNVLKPHHDATLAQGSGGWFDCQFLLTAAQLVQLCLHNVNELSRPAITARKVNPNETKFLRERSFA